MDADQIRRLRPMLTSYLGRFASCFARRDTQVYLPLYVEGQLSNLPEKSCEPIALAMGVPPRTLQAFLARYKWNEDSARRRLHAMVAK
jgi:SRSO17 transposase